MQSLSMEYLILLRQTPPLLRIWKSLNQYSLRKADLVPWICIVPKKGWSMQTSCHLLLSSQLTTRFIYIVYDLQKLWILTSELIVWCHKLFTTKFPLHSLYIELWDIQQLDNSAHTSIFICTHYHRLFMFLQLQYCMSSYSI